MGTEVLPELKQIVGALLFGAGKPLTLKEMRACLVETGERYGAETKAFEEVSEGDLEAVVKELAADLERQKLGFHLQEHGGAFRFQSDASCGKWLKQLLAIGQANRLSRPALETLSIIAYRQPITKAEIERVRGVNVDHMIRMLMEMQLVRISGRSDLPGRPFLFGTTQSFLEHFGLKDLKDLSDLEPMLRAGAAEDKQAGSSPAPADAATGTTDPADGAQAVAGTPSEAAGGDAGVARADWIAQEGEQK
jgi:segregation and condensation protein B